MARLQQALAACLMLLAASQLRTAAAADCNQTFLDAIGGGDTWLFRQGLSLAGYEDKLPSPDIGVTILVPNNKAWWNFLWRNGFLFGQLGDLGDKLLSVMTFHIIPSAVTPDKLSGPEGTLPTLYGLLTQQSADLKHWTKFDDGQFLFQGPWDDTVAGVTDDNKIQVCNSWVYIVDEVLKPAYDLDDVLDVEIPDFSFGDNSAPSPSPSPPPPPSTVPTPTPAPGSPAAGSPAPAPSTPAPPACDKTFAQVAGETSGLGLLQTVLSQDAYASALPDPSNDFTLFAPTDAAFFDLLSTFNLSITDALSLGDKLTAVLLYHVAPGALTPEELAKQTLLTTGLAVKTKDAGYTVTVGASGGSTTVSGKYPGNTATVGTNVAVCSSQIYVIDKVLVPAASLDAIPAVSGGLDPASVPAASVPAPLPSPAVEAATPAAAPVAEEPEVPAVTEVQGVALATGYLQGCTVRLSSVGGGPQTATTDADGQFSFQCEGDCTGKVVALPAAGQPTTCLDSLTQLPPPFDIQAPVSALPEGISLSALSPLTTVIAAANAQTAAPAPEAAPPTNRKLLAGRSALAAAQAAALQQRAQRRRVLAAGFDFGIASEEASGSSNVSTSYGDPLAASLAGDQAAYDLLAKNQELVCTGGIGGSLLAALAGGGSTTAAAGAGAVFDQLAGDLLAGSAFDLTDNSTVQQLFAEALADLAPDAGPPAGVDVDAVTAAAAETTTLLNSLLQQAVTAAQQSQLAEAGKMVQVLARLAKVCQADVAPAAAQLGAGQLSVDGWRQQFSLQAITDLTINETLG